MTNQFSLITQTMPSILIVDDTVSNLQHLAETLLEHGYEPRPVPSGKLAFEAALADPPDLILLDVNMPEMDGIELCRRLQADAALKEIPIIFITGMTDTDDKVKGFAAGAVDYLTKPFQTEEVIARLSVHLKNQTLQRQLRSQNENLEQLVAQRTRELEKAYERQVELNRLKNDFLTMIAHEIRTPVNGVLGIGEIILELCPPSDQCAIYSEHFRSSSQRLRNLIKDATMIVDMDHLVKEQGESISFAELLKNTSASLSAIKIILNSKPECDIVLLKGNPEWLRKSLATMIQVAAAFSKDQHRAEAEGLNEGDFLRLQFTLDAWPQSGGPWTDFFRLESPVRTSSPAEFLGLAPIVAHKIITLFGGEAHFIQEGTTRGRLEVALRLADG